MNENESGQTPNENENTETNENANQGNETGLDAAELKSMIKNLSAQVDSLKAELAKKEPEPPVDRSKEVNDYFLNLMKGR